MIGGQFSIGGMTKFVNTDKWGADAGWFRVKDSNSAAPHAYFDISAKINLDTKKIVENIR